MRSGTNNFFSSSSSSSSYQAVRQGDLREFHRVVEAHAATFKADKTYTLNLRLAHNVIKTGEE